MKATVASFTLETQRSAGPAAARRPQVPSVKAPVKRSSKAPAKSFAHSGKNGHTNGHAKAEELIPFGEDDVVLSEF